MSGDVEILSLEDYFRLRVALEAFTVKDLQTTGMLISWARQCGFTMEQIQLGASIIPALRDLDAVGYFRKHHTIPQLQRIKELEKRLPKDLRKTMRKLRLENSVSGPLQPGKG